MPHIVTSQRSQGQSPASARPDTRSLIAFALTTLFAGGNAVAIRLGYAELAPFWGAALRFLAAGLILLVLAAFLRLAWPRGRALAGVAIYGGLNFGLAYMFGYWALQEVGAGTAMVILAITPLLTLILAVLRGSERFHIKGLIGALLAAIGIGAIFGISVTPAPTSALVALLGGALCIAEGAVVVKTFPRVHPVIENALGMVLGGGFLLALSFGFGEPWAIPVQPATQISLLYLIFLGSIGLFVLYLFLLGRWAASSASYAMLLAPVVTIALGLVILDEAVRPELLVGGALVLLGVYLGAFSALPAGGEGSSNHRGG